MSDGTPMTSSAPYRYPLEGTLPSVTVMSFDAPGASVKSPSLTATPDSVARRLGATTPLEDCVQGRAATVTTSAFLELLATVSLSAAPACAGRSTISAESVVALSAR